MARTPRSDSSTLGTAAAALQRRSRGNMSADVAEHIRDMIFDGRLNGGERVPQDLIAEDLGVSRLPVREALISLQVDGLVASEPRRGTFVVPLSVEDIEDHYAMYGHMLGLAARRACTKVDDAVLNRLDALMETMKRDPSAPSTHEAHWDFHALVSHLGGSQRLRAVLRQMAHNLPRPIYDIPPAASLEAERGHREIVTALRERDAAAAAAACERHLLHDGTVVIAALKQRGLFA